jgi:hypothetical protein
VNKQPKGISSGLHFIINKRRCTISYRKYEAGNHNLWQAEMVQTFFHRQTQRSFLPELKQYEQALLQLDLENLHDRRTILCLNFARKSSKNPETSDMFPRNYKKHNMGTRSPEEFQVLKGY